MINLSHNKFSSSFGLQLRKTVKRQIGILISSIILIINLVHSQTVYVDVNATGNNDGSSWTNAFISLQAGINKAIPEAGDVWVAQGVYYENIVLDGNVSIWGGFDGTEDSLQQRNYELNKTIIDGGKIRRVILCYGYNIIDGFVIRNGSTEYTSGEVLPGRGGGILMYHAGGIIRNNFITENIAGWGAGIFLDGEAVLIEYNVVTKNHGSVCAGGIEMTNSASIVRYNTIVDNIGFGLEIPTNPPIILGDFYSNIIFGNEFNHHERFLEPPTGKDVWAYARACTDYSFIGEIWNSDPLWGSPFDHSTNIYGDYSNVEPCFIDREDQDFHLLSNSPCIGSGKPDETENPTDMGAFQYEPLNEINGTIRYWDNNIPISYVKIKLIKDDLIDSAYTDMNGYYEFLRLDSNENYTVRTSKPPNTDIGDFNITMYDAALVAQAAVGIRQFTDYEAIAADVNKDGHIYTIDATLIAQYAVGLPNLPISCVGEWKFIPDSTCYHPLEMNQTDQDYKGIILGNIHGGWILP